MDELKDKKPEVVEEATPETPPSVEDESGEETTAPLRGRAAALARWKEGNPDATEDPDDDSLFDHMQASRDKLQGDYDKLSGANGRLAELAARDPRLAAVLSLIAGEDGKSFPYAFARVYGKDMLDMDEEALEEFEKGYQENLDDLAKSNQKLEAARKNIEGYKQNLAEFGRLHNLTEGQLDELNAAIYADAENFLTGVIPTEYIEYRWKGMNYDKDVQDAADTGVVEGKNQAISEKMAKVEEPPPIPDMGDTTNAGRKPTAPPARSKKSFFDGMKEEKI